MDIDAQAFLQSIAQAKQELSTAQRYIAEQMAANDGDKVEQASRATLGLTMAVSAIQAWLEAQDRLLAQLTLRLTGTTS